VILPTFLKHLAEKGRHYNYFLGPPAECWPFISFAADGPRFEKEKKEKKEKERERERENRFS
jgi:hypothetical protein